MAEVNVPVLTKGVPPPVRLYVLEPALRVWLLAMVKMLEIVVVPVPWAVVVAAVLPSPKVKLKNVQDGENPELPRLPVDCKVVVPFEKFMFPQVVWQIIFPPFTVMLLVPDKVPAFIVRSLSMVVLVAVKLQPPEPLKIMFSKVLVELFMVCPVLAAVNVVVWVEDLVKVPLFM